MKPPQLPKLSIPFMGGSSNQSRNQAAPELPLTTNDVVASQGDGSGMSRPQAQRSHSLQDPFPTYLRSPTTPATPPGLPPPVTAPNPGISSALYTGGGPPTPSTPARHRAHTVSVSIKPRNRRLSVSQPSTADQRRGSQPSASGDDGARRNSIRSSSDRRGSLVNRTRERSASTSSPVNFDLQEEGTQINDEVVGMLDCIDPHVSTVNHLQNMSNGLIFPHLPSLWSRRPEVVLPETPSDESLVPLTQPEDGDIPLTAQVGTPPSGRRRRATTVTRPRSSTVSRLFPSTPVDTPSSYPFSSNAPTATTAGTGPFQSIPESPPPPTRPEHELPLTDTQEEFEHDVDLIEEDGELDKHVRHVLKNKSKKQQLKRVARGFWTFVKTPMGIATAIYGFLVVFWGAALVLFLVGWINTGSKHWKDKWVEICSQIVNGLFTVTGVGLIPWRLTDSWCMYNIWRLQRATIKRRQAQGLPPIDDPNDLPDPKEAADYVSVLTEKEQAKLLSEQVKFAKSQTWYRPHATATHKAFPISWALWNTLLMDGNSFFQCILCGCMWGMNYHKRPAWTTGSLIPLSFLCGIGAGVLIWQGSARTKKTISVEDKLRQALGVPLAIGGVPQTKDGTVITSNNRAPTPPSPNISTSSGSRSSDADGLSKDSKEKEKETEGGKGKVERRTTITFGSVTDEKDQGRQRGVTVASPERRADQKLGE